MTRECRIPVPDDLPEPVPPRELVERYQPVLGAAARAYKDWVMSLSGVDAVTSEVVRLRCARTHACRLCQSLRWSDAREDGFDDAVDAAIDRYEDSALEERHKVALRLTDAYVTLPATIDEELASQVGSMFTAEEIVELVLDMSKWSTQKVHVALRIDADSGGRRYFTVDDGGQLRYVEVGATSSSSASNE
jgi:alkylhydroperoxidase family enzyme